MNVERYDVGIVGAGPAGSSAAFFLARKGYSVLLIDKRFFPRDKLCGDFISPINWPLFERLGVADKIISLKHDKVTAFSLSSSSGEEATFHLPHGEGRRFFGLGLSRSSLDHLLLKQADRAGATVMQGTRVRDLKQQEDGWSITLSNQVISNTGFEPPCSTKGESYRFSPRGVMDRNSTGDTPSALCPPQEAGFELNASGKRTLHLAFLIGADGRNSWVAHRLGLTKRRESRGRYLGFQLHLHGAKQLTGQVQIHLYPGGYAGLVGLGGGIANLCFTVERRRFNKNIPIDGLLENCLYQNPRLKEILKNSEILGNAHSAYPIYFSPRKSFGDGFLLVGDAARVLEPVTGEGVNFALKSGDLAAAAIHQAFVSGNHKAESLVSYERSCKRCFASRLRVNRFIRTLVYRPPLLRPLIRLSSKTSFPLGPLINSVVQSGAKLYSAP
jgi:flavin-dependent dehydrogenase